MAQASTISAEFNPESGRADEQISYRYDAASGERNNVRIERAQVLQNTSVLGIFRIAVATVTFSESGALITNAPVFVPGNGLLVTGLGSLCVAPLLPTVLCATQTRTVAVSAFVGDGDDRVDVSRWSPVGFGDGTGVVAGAGNDTVIAGPAPDFIDAGEGDDRIVLPKDGIGELVRCGPGLDTVTRTGGVDLNEAINPDCEVVN